MWISCGNGNNEVEKPVITVSIPPQKYMVEQLAGDLADVNVMIPPGASPATYEPTLSQLGKLDRSRLYLKMGHLGFEKSWMDKIRGVNPRMKVIDLSAGIDLISEAEKRDHLHYHSPGEKNGHHHGTDPHTWMSVHNVRTMSRWIHEELVILFPGEVSDLRKRLEQFETSLDSLHRSIEQILAGKQGGHFMIYHPALSYFARDYQLHQHALEFEGKIPSPAHIRELTDLGREKKIRAILVQQEFDQDNAEVLARDLGAKIIQINPLNEDWYGQMHYIAIKLADSL